MLVNPDAIVVVDDDDGECSVVAVIPIGNSDNFVAGPDSVGAINANGVKCATLAAAVPASWLIVVANFCQLFPSHQTTVRDVGSTPDGNVIPE